MVPCTALQKVECLYCVQCMQTKGEADRRHVTALSCTNNIVMCSMESGGQPSARRMLRSITIT